MKHCWAQFCECRDGTTELTAVNWTLAVQNLLRYLWTQNQPSWLQQVINQEHFNLPSFSVQSKYFNLEWIYNLENFTINTYYCRHRKRTLPYSGRHQAKYDTIQPIVGQSRAWASPLVSSPADDFQLLDVPCLDCSSLFRWPNLFPPETRPRYPAKESPRSAVHIFLANQQEGKGRVPWASKPHWNVTWWDRKPTVTTKMISLSLEMDRRESWEKEASSMGTISCRCWEIN